MRIARRIQALTYNRRVAMPTLVACVLFLVAGCSALTDSGKKRQILLSERDTEFGRVLLDYEKLPTHRALAVAGDVKTTKWLVGVAGRASSPKVAQQAALERCLAERKRRSFVAPCRLFAVNEKGFDWLGKRPE